MNGAECSYCGSCSHNDGNCPTHNEKKEDLIIVSKEDLNPYLSSMKSFL